MRSANEMTVSTAKTFDPRRRERTSLDKMIWLLVSNLSGPPRRLRHLSLIVGKLDLLVGLDDLDPQLANGFACLLREHPELGSIPFGERTGAEGVRNEGGSDRR